MDFPHTFTITFVSYCCKNGMSLSIKTSMPGFCRPMAFNIPPYTSAIRGVGLPGQGTFATPFVTTAPNLFKSTNSPYSIPEPKVPEPVITGFLNSTPAIFTLVFIRFPPPVPQIRGLPYKFWCCSHGNAGPSLQSLPHSLSRRRFRMPCVPLRKYRRECPLLPHIF